MKKQTIAMLCLSLCAPAVMSQEPAPAPEPAAAPAAEAPAAEAPATPTPEQIREVISYYLGFQTGAQFGSEGPIKIEDFDREVFFKAFEDGLNNKVDPNMMKQNLSLIMAAYSNILSSRTEEIAKSNTAAAAAFFPENAKKEGVVTTESGLQYKVLTQGEGRKYDAEQDGPQADVTFEYEGRLLNGTVFDSTEQGQPASMPINGLIPGMTEALKLMPIGSEWEVYIPAALAYGDQAPPVIGPQSALIFKIKLVDIKPKKGSEGNPIELTPEMIKQLQEAGMQPV